MNFHGGPWKQKQKAKHTMDTPGVPWTLTYRSNSCSLTVPIYYLHN